MLTRASLYDCTIVSERDDSFTSQTRITAHNNLTPHQSLQPVIDESRLQAIAGPGPSTLATRQSERSNTPLEEVNGRLWAHMRESRTKSGGSSHTAEKKFRRNSVDLEDLWELEDLVGESGNDEIEGPSDKTSRRLKRMRNDRVEITDELTESTIITQMLERVHEDGRRWSSSRHARQRSAPMPEVTVEDVEDEEPELYISTTTTSSRRRSVVSLSSLAEDDDWIEVDQLLGEHGPHPEEADIPSAPNGSTSIGTMSYRDALEHPSAGSERIQLVLKTMTNKLLQRRRTVRRVRGEDRSSSSPKGSAGRDGSVTPTQTDIRRIEWGRETPDQSDVSSSVTSASSYAPLAQKPLAISGSMSRLFPSRLTKSPPSAYDRHVSSTAKKESSVGRAISRARSAFRSSRRSSRSSSPDSSSLAPTVATSPDRTAESPASSPVVTPPCELPLSTLDGVKAPPPTPFVSSIFRTPGQHRVLPHSRSSQDTRPSITALHESVRTSQSRVQAASTEAVSETPGSLFPHDSLIRNIHRFMRYSSAAYGVSPCVRSSLLG